ncbi:MAG: DMT family transporter, partial [Saprospiraceae bacterium]|nr:DMT family transporter [Saprospiraceae bacterium]
PILAAIISFSTGLLSLLLFFIFFNEKSLPSLKTLSGLSWWQFTGGLLGAFFVTTVILSVKEIGSANMTALIVAGQVLGAIVIDHYGWLGLCSTPSVFFAFLGLF